MKKRAKALILTTAGTNCDNETVHAFRMAGAEARKEHVNDFITGRRELGEYNILAIPGGFSFGDDIAAGKVFANKLKFRLEGEIEKFYNDGKLIIGICNGFQVLAKIGILPNLGQKYKQEITLSSNSSAKFEDRWLSLKTNHKSPCVFTKGMPGVLQLPIAHGEGRYIPVNSRVRKKVLNKNLVVFQYSNGAGRLGNDKTNPNGSVDSIAAICDASGRVLGMMPHPERYVNRLQHPQWMRIDLPEEGVGLKIFRNAVAYVKENL